MARDQEGLDWHYETSEVLDLTLLQRMRHFPREPEMLMYALRSVAALVLRTWLRMYHRLEILGREYLPAEGSFILVSNHASHLDALCLLAALPLRKLHRTFPAAASDYFFTSVPRLAVAAILINALPFDRAAHVRQSIILCRELLKNPGNILIIFPEGTRSRTGQMGEFKPGIGALLAGTGMPALPCYLAGTFRALPKGALFPRPRRLRLIIGKPRSFPDAPQGKAAAQEIARELEEAILELRRSHESGT